MCGLAGFIDLTHKTTESDLRRMTGCLAHRGPDAEGIYFKNAIGLAHRRLSILDLSRAANQPMYSSDGKHVIVYNGEVYNYQEIASRLNLKLETQSDTEAILKAFLKLGPDFVKELNGMFAICILDIQNQTLYLFRDRFGIKPLYYFFNGQQFAFASELKSLINLPFIKRGLTINKTAVSLFLQLGYIPRPHSIYCGIQKMDSGSYIIVNQQKLTHHQYWDLYGLQKTTIDLSEADAQQTLQTLLINSVRNCLLSDVPVGSFLSGGIDSSLITAIAQQHSNKALKTFSVGIKDNPSDESVFAARVAKHLGTDHQQVYISASEVKEQILKLPAIYDEPFGDSSAIPALLISEKARKTVTVALSGDGADELFLGYGRYQWAERLRNPALSTFRKPVSSSFQLLGKRYAKAAAILNYPHKNRINQHIFSQEQLFFSESDLRRLLQPDYQVNSEMETLLLAKASGYSVSEQQALFDLKYYLQDDLMVKMDRATMQHSLEGRFPFLDHHLAEFVINLPPNFKIHNGHRKYLLKQVLYQYVPEHFFKRPKQGFSIPLQDWLQTDLKFLLDEFLNERLVIAAGLVNYRVVANLKKKYLAGNNNLYHKIWLLIMLHQWFKVNNQTL